MIKTILVPVDGSVHANTAVDWASDLATKYHAKLIVLHVIPEEAADECAWRSSRTGEGREYD